MIVSVVSDQVPHYKHVLLLQVLETGVGSGEGDSEEEERGWVSSLGWAPMGPSVGQLAAATSRSIHIYSPAGLSTSSTCSLSMPGRSPFPDPKSSMKSM